MNETLIQPDAAPAEEVAPAQPEVAPVVDTPVEPTPEVAPVVTETVEAAPAVEVVEVETWNGVPVLSKSWYSAPPGLVNSALVGNFVDLELVDGTTARVQKDALLLAGVSLRQ